MIDSAGAHGFFVDNRRLSGTTDTAVANHRVVRHCTHNLL